MSVKRRALLAKQHRAFERISVRIQARRSVGFLDEAVAAEPGRVLAAAREQPRAGHPVAAIDRDGGPVGRTRRHDRTRVAENVAYDLGLQVCGRHHGSGCLADAPGGAGIRLGDLLDGLKERRGIELAAAKPARQQHAEQLCSVQRGQDLLGDLALALDAVGGSGHHRRDVARPRDPPARGGLRSGTLSSGATRFSIYDPPHALLRFAGGVFHGHEHRSFAASLSTRSSKREHAVAAADHVGVHGVGEHAPVDALLHVEELVEPVLHHRARRLQAGQGPWSAVRTNSKWGSRRATS